MKLSKTDFDIFDKLFNKIGFGSYYDCIQLLKDTIYYIEPKLQCKLEKETDLFILINLIVRLTNKLGKRPPDNKELIEKFLKRLNWILGRIEFHTENPDSELMDEISEEYRKWEVEK